MQSTTMPIGVLNEQIIVADYLIGAKSAIKGCATALAEAATPEVRNILKQHLNDAIAFHEQISQYMVNKGYYHPTNVQEQLRLDIQAAQQMVQSAGH